MEQEFRVDGMSCMHCANRVKKAIEAVDGVEKADINLESSKAIVVGNFSKEAIAEAVDKSGYTFVG